MSPGRQSRAEPPQTLFWGRLWGLGAAITEPAHLKFKINISPSFFFVYSVLRSSSEHISLAYHLLVTRLQEEHAEMRFSAFQVVQELFARSHQFRTLLIADFQEFLELTVGTDHEQPLPPPKEVAQKLRRAAIKAVQDWHEKYGQAYKQLSLGYHFLKQNKKVLWGFTPLCGVR